MNQQTVERVEAWDSRPVGDGYDGLRELADAEFSGAVAAGMTWAFLLNGRVVAIFDGSMESFEDTGLTAYTAPDPAVALLYAMKETGGETRAKYYTNDTPISEADRTLSSGSFTGYLELSENVLSGDYYVCYYGGKKMSCAFIGNNDRLATGDEAFDKADNEVGIYEVLDVELDVQEVPEPEPDEPAGAAAAAGGDDPAGSAADGGATTEEPAAADPAPDEQPGGDAVAADPAPDEAVAADPAPDEAAPDPAPSDASAEPGRAEPDDGITVAEAADPAGATDAEPREPATAGSAEPEVSPEEAGASWDPDLDEADADAPATDDPEVQELIDAAEAEIEDDERFEQEQQWRETRSIPSIDPEQTTAAADEAERSPPGGGGGAPGGQSTPDRNAGGSRDAASRGTERAAAAGRSSSAEGDDSAAELKARLSELKEERERFRERAEALEGELQDREATIEELEREIERLETQVDQLEGDLEDARQAARDAQDGPTTASQQLTPRQAMEGTNLFVRYGSKGEATLEDARDDVASPDAVNGNLRIERHTQFDESDVAVDGQDFADFLTGTTAFQFVEWVIRDLLFEIRDTGNADSLAELYDVLPSIDRAELNGIVDVHRQEDGEEIREQEQFDVVLRDRMGHPLILANINDSRDPASQDMMTDLQTSAQDVKRTHEQLGAAVLVTTSFFDPGALETAEEATSGSFLSRDSRKSYVKLSRKQGYHLCLVETRGGKFHINVPEL